MSELSRRYPFDVRPGHRETMESYTRRLLEANFETDQHRNQLITLTTHSKTRIDRDAAWLSVLTAKNKRADLHLLPHPSGWLTHDDGSTCEFCSELLPQRWMCTLCSHGASIEQNPHFENLVCIRHSRWVGMTTAPEDQHPVTSEHIEAEIQFRKLRRQHRIDVRLFTLLGQALAPEADRDDDSPTEAETFPLAIAIAAAITTPDFARIFFNPNTRFTDAYAHLVSTLDNVIGSPATDLSRALWLYARPTAWAVRHSALTASPFELAWPHDFPLNTAVANSLTSGPTELEPFSNYLAVTGDDPASAARFGLGFVSERRVGAPNPSVGRKRQVLTICSSGHQFETDRARPFAPPATTPLKCPVCQNDVIQPGYNDLESSHPEIAAEFDETKNGGLTAKQIPASSKEYYIWRCAKGHNYPATASNRTAARSKCPVCLNRLIVPGINDIATTHPQLLAEWHPSWLRRFPPTKYGAGSQESIRWVCPNDHEYPMSIADRVKSKGCQQCRTGRKRPGTEGLDESHPLIAAEWHPTLNGKVKPSDRTRGSGDNMYWLCPAGHTYRERIERRTAGYKCSVCSRRTLVPGVNDLASTQPILVTEFHPYLNHPKVPSKISAGTQLLWWKCTANGHTHQQSVPHRLLSKGCPKCPAEERILRTTV
ncbi:zinc-ribbon domain-containing protein [Cryobacterium glucosi]|uniref:Treble clef zinc finger domain-containing protein n=1 Tax=Cryobacterium glucosi TaxID=1259175 RepID=A0ABY2IRQ6_9MICO|nr:zinc-ribbon domain-containing protein [Cryobacterium glucosi]TFC23370.1 hypothetical protein E3O46_02045 [Cryobacterium glucosi]